ncbi:trypsin-like peptidase domain-containing protein [Sulfuricurvum sp.]|uniref:trypsin-like peptidase domain-containing protein n=1 Tax=Sulfuricurvum sp. TaxID=2025608 RepID=UPI003C650CF0
MKIFFFIAILLCSLATSEPFNGISKQVKTVLPSIVKIKVQKSEPSGDESELTAADSGGSGFILDDKHHIVTNAHVIGDAKKIAIIDHNNNEYSAILIAKDNKTDIAVLEAPTFNGPTLLEGNMSVSAGDGVFAIGAPFSLGHSVSYGIVGAVNRFLPNYPYIRFIQIDAAINPGNSGGPLFNQQGELIGMTSTYFSKQGSYTNIAFALPIADIHRVASHLIHEKRIDRGYFGAEIFVSERLSRKLGYKASIFLSRIDPDSPAHISGLKSGDIIIGYNDINLDDGGELHRSLEQSRPGDTITLTLIRDKQRKTLEVKLGSTPIEKKETTNAGTADISEKSGLVLRENTTGIEVIVSYSIAKTVGIDPNDRILEINGTAVKSIQEFNTQLSKLKEGEIALLTIGRNGTTHILPIGSKTAFKGYMSRN